MTQWLATVTQYPPGRILIQDDEQRLYPAKLDTITPESVGNEIAIIAGIPRNRVLYHDTTQTMYRRMTLFRFEVLN
jgi:hypothetical protein